MNFSIWTFTQWDVLFFRIYTLLNCSFNAFAFNESSLTIDPPTCKSPMPWLSCLSFEIMKVQNDFGLSVMLVVRNWLIWDTLSARSSLCTVFLMSQNSCQSSWFLVFFALLYNRCFLLHNFFKFFVNQGRLCLDEVKKCGTNVLIISVTLRSTMFHLSLTVMLSFRTLYSCLKLSKCFRILHCPLYFWGTFCV